MMYNAPTLYGRDQVRTQFYQRLIDNGATCLKLQTTSIKQCCATVEETGIGAAFYCNGSQMCKADYMAVWKHEADG